MRATNFKLSVSLTIVVALVETFGSADCAAQVVDTGLGSGDGPASYISRLSASHRFGDGPGFSDGYTTIEWLLPTYDNWDDRMLFFDGRAIISDDEARLGSNLGVVYREYDSGLNRIFGAMAYWDTRYTDHTVFQQGTFGVETLGQYVDARAFLHVPGSYRSANTNPNQFQGNLFVLGGRTVALTGGTAEVGVNLPRMGDFQASGFGGYYRFEDDESPTAKGWSTRAELWWRDTVGVDFRMQDDDVFGRTTSIGVTFTQLADMGYLARKSMDHMFRPRSVNRVDSRLGEHVRRLENIVVNEVRPPAPATNLGVPYNFLHVVSGAPAGGDGSISMPYNSFAAALADANAGNSIIYTPSGGNFTGPVPLVDGATVWSNGPTRTINTQLGPTVLPFSGTTADLTGLPTITGDVQLANNNIVSGFDITGDVTGVGIMDTMFTDNRVTSAAGDAIAISGGSDNISLSNLELAAGMTGLRVNDSSVSVADTTISSAGEDGVEVTVGGTDRTLTATNLTVSSAASQGIDLDVTGAGSLTATINGTNSISATDDAFELTLEPASAGNAILQMDNTTLSSTSGFGANISGAGGTGNLLVESYAGNIVTQAKAGGVRFDTVMFDADSSTVGLDPLTMTELTIGDPATPANIEQNGLEITESAGDLTIGSLVISNSAATGLLVANTGPPLLTLATGPSGSINTMDGTAMDLSNAVVQIEFESVQSTDSLGNGILLDMLSGNIAVQNTTITGSALDAVFVSNTQPTLVADFNNANFLIGDVGLLANGGNLTFITNTFNFVD